MWEYWPVVDICVLKYMTGSVTPLFNTQDKNEVRNEQHKTNKLTPKQLSIPSYLHSCQHITRVQSDVILIGERRQNTELGKTIFLTHIHLIILFNIEMGK